MNRVQSLLRVNPIIVKELRSRMRGPRAFITLTISLLAIGGLVYAVLQVMLAMADYQTDIVSPRIGQSMFSVLVFLELALICAITPAVTAGAISGEREKQTYEMLQATPLSAAAIVWGKLVSALSYVFIILFAGVPLASLVFIFGGVALRDMAKALVVLVVLALSFGVLGLFLSALFKKTGRATVASFVIVVLLVFAPLFAALAYSIVKQGSEIPRWLLAPSPFSMLAAAIGPGATQYGLLGSFLPIFGGYWMQAAMSPISQLGVPRPLYHYAIPGYLGVTLVLYLLTTRLIRPAHRWHFSKKEIIVWVVVILAFAGLVTAGYFATADQYEWVKPPESQPAVPPNAITVPAVPVFGGGGGGGMVEGPAAGMAMPTPTLVPVDAQNPDMMAYLYGMVIREFYADTHTKGGNNTKSSQLFVLMKTEPGLAGGSGQAGESQLLSDTVLNLIDTNLKDLPDGYKWTLDAKELAVDESGKLKDGQALVTLGSIAQTGNDVDIPASLQIGGAEPKLQHFRFRWENSIWNLMPAEETKNPLASEEMAAIYTAVVRQLATKDTSFGDNPPAIPFLYIVGTTTDQAGNPGAKSDNPAPIPEEVQTLVKESLSGLPSSVQWVPTREDVPLVKPNNQVKDGGAYIQLGNIYRQNDGTVQVAGSIYFAGLAASGRTYVLSQQDGKWVITGKTGSEWIS